MGKLGRDVKERVAARIGHDKEALTLVCAVVEALAARRKRRRPKRPFEKNSNKSP